MSNLANVHFLQLLDEGVCSPEHTQINILLIKNQLTR